MKTRLLPILILITFIVASGCSSMVNGTRQSIPVNTTPAGANVLVDCGAVPVTLTPVVTPATVELKRKTQPCLITLQKEGYEDTSIIFARKVSGWVWGNLFFGGLVGWAIDGMSGGMFYKVPETVQVELREEQAKTSAQPQSEEE
ncbi:MAG: hypothetical protein ABR524_12370 [Thermoanaerobaculia bacterium]